MDEKPIPIPNEIVAFATCKRCFEEKPDGESLAGFARLSVGLTPYGLQVWCLRHDINITAFSFREENAVMMSMTHLFESDYVDWRTHVGMDAALPSDNEFFDEVAEEELEEAEDEA